MKRKFDGNIPFQAEDSNFPNPIAAFANGTKYVRISKRVAQEWILHQQTVIYQGKVRYLQIASTGIGTYMARLSPNELMCTQMVKSLTEG